MPADRAEFFTHFSPPPASSARRSRAFNEVTKVVAGPTRIGEKREYGHMSKSIAVLPVEHNLARLTLRAWSVDDAKAMHNVILRNQDWFSEWFPWAKQPNDVEDTRTNLVESAQKFAAGTQFSYAMRLRDERNVFGMVALYASDKPLVFEFGYWMDRVATGKGYMTEAVTGLLHSGFTHLDIDAVEIHADKNNVSSLSIPRRLGFSLAGEIEGQGPDKARGLSGRKEVWRIHRAECERAST